MSTENPDALAESAERIADGGTVDWERLRREAPGELGRLESLSRLERLATAWRELEGGAAPEGDSAPEPLLRWGDLEAIERLGAGSFGDVYRAWDPALRRDVALKLRRDGAAGDSARRWLDEARRLARVRHPNVLQVFGVDVRDGIAGLWTELVHGETLEQLLLARGRFGAEEAAAIGRELCRALAAVHAAGLVHGDLKPGNVMREDGGRIVLMDFGSGFEPDDAAAPVATSPLAAAPERLAGDPAGPASDLYSLGVLLFRLVTARWPVEAPTLEALRARHAAGERASLRELRPDLPSAFVAAVESALAADPARRVATAADLERRLGGAAAPVPAPPRAQPRVRARGVAAFAAVAALVAVAWFAWRPRPELPAPAVTRDAAVATPTSAPAPVTPAAPVSGRSRPLADARLWRLHEGEREGLSSGGAIAPGDHLWLAYEATEPLHVYVLDEDDHGETYALFPVAGTDLANPLRAHRALRLPGSREGREFDWVVTSAGGREQVLVVASRVPLPVLDRLVAAVPAADSAQPVRYAAVGEGAIAALRGIGGMAPAPPEAHEGRLGALARELAARPDSSVRAWHLVLAGK